MIHDQHVMDISNMFCFPEQAKVLLLKYIKQEREGERDRSYDVDELLPRTPKTLL